MTIPKAQQARGFFRATPQRMPNQRRLGQPLKAKVKVANRLSLAELWVSLNMTAVMNRRYQPVDRNPAVHHCPPHTERMFDPHALRAIAQRVVDVYYEEKLKALLVCGHSGLLLAGAASALGGIRVFAARKQGDRPVAGVQGLDVNGVAPEGPVKRWAWLDDHISSGGTFDRSRRLAKDAGLIATTIPAFFLLYEGDGTYYMTEDRYTGWCPGGLEADEVRVRTIRV